MIRVSAKAMIIHEGQLLVLEHQRPDGIHYSLPGGGQDWGEPLSRTVVREVAEETGAEVVAGQVVFVRDYVAKNHEFAALENKDFHQVEIVFHCTLKAPYAPKSGHIMDKEQTGVTWLSLEGLAEADLWPRCFREAIVKFNREQGGVDYLGDKN